MCIAAWAWHAHPDYPLIVVANRDERHERPTDPLSRWNDGSGIIAGRDRLSGGTWLGLSEQTGRFALITNFRTEALLPDSPSRGELLTDWLTGAWRNVDDRGAALSRYNGFTLLLVDGGHGWVIGNLEHHAALPIDGGIHGLSNGPFCRPWPKTERLVNDLRGAIGTGNAAQAPDETELFRILDRRSSITSPDAVGAPAFIKDPVYGTRCSTVVIAKADGTGSITERRFDADGEAVGETRIAFSLRSAA